MKEERSKPSEATVDQVIDALQQYLEELQRSFEPMRQYLPKDLFERQINQNHQTLGETIEVIQKRFGITLRTTGFLQQFDAFARRSLKIDEKDIEKDIVGLEHITSSNKRLHVFASYLLNALTLYKQRINQASDRIASFASSFVKNGAVVCIFGFSMAVHKALQDFRRVFQLGISVVLVQTVVQNRNQGVSFEMQLQSLSELNIPVQIVSEGGLFSVAPQIDLFITGAECMSRNCGLINQIGTAQIAFVSNLYKKPFIVLAQWHKFVEKFCFTDGELWKRLRTDADANIHNGFQNEPTRFQDAVDLPNLRYLDKYLDFTSPEYISYVVTETGVFTTTQAADEADRLFEK